MRLLNALILALCIIGLPRPAHAQSSEPIDTLLFQIGVGLMLTENFPEAEACFAQLASTAPEETAVYNNRGVNLAMWGMSLLKSDEAAGQIKYVFPFEAAPDLNTKGNTEEEELRQAQISRLFEAAAAQFEQCITLEPDEAGGYLNLASAQALLARWQETPALLRSAYQNINAAEQKAAEKSSTKGYSLIVKGIIYDYLENTEKRDEYFGLAERQHAVHPDTRLGSLIERNKTVAAGGAMAFASSKGEYFDIMLDEPESIDGISLQQLIRSPNLEMDTEVTAIGGAKLFRKDFPQSTLYVYFRDASRYLFFHHTGKNYSEQTSKGIRAGDNEAYLAEAYGTPLRAQPALGGRFLLYKKARLIFFIGQDGRIKSWASWQEKK